MALKRPAPVPREKLLRAMRNIPDDASFLCGMAVNDGEDFLQGLKLNRSQFLSKAQLMAEINGSSYQEFHHVRGHDDDLLITPRLYVWKDSINHSQRFPATPGAEQYTHVQDRGNPYYDIYFYLNRERKTITFALGDRKMELPVIEYSGWCWKPTARGLLCMDIDKLEQDFLDPFWNPIAVNVGRNVLKIRPAV